MRFLFVCFLISTALNAQSVCEIWQFAGDDSTNKTLAKKITYNDRGQKIADFTNGYKTGAVMDADGSSVYTYLDTLLVGWTAAYTNGDSSRMKLEYNDKGQLIRQSLFEREATLQEISDKYPGTIQLNTGPLNPNAGKWIQTSLVNYSYDSKGRKILYDASKLHYTSQNIYKWEYDDRGRVIKHQSFTGPKLIWQEDYQYFDWGYKYWRVWYDEGGNMRHENEYGSPGYWPLYIYNVKVDNKQREYQVFVTDEKQRMQEQTKTTYDEKDRVTRTEYYGPDNHVAITHIYVYR